MPDFVSSDPQNDPRDHAKQRALAYIRTTAVDEQITTLIRKTFEDFLIADPIVLTRNEKRVLYKSVLQTVFDEILADN